MVEAVAEPAKTRRAGWARRHPILCGLAAIVLLSVVCAAAPLALAAPRLLSARDAASAGQDALRAGDLETARAALADAERDFRRARRLLRNPAAAIGGAVPWLGHNLRTAGALAAAGELTAGAAAGVAEELERIGGIDTLAPDEGVLPVAEIRQLAEPITAAAADLEQAIQLAESSQELLLVPQVADAREQLIAQLRDVAPAARGAASLAQALPGFLGADGPRTYFFGASTPGEQRGSGGFIGAYSLLTVDEGELSFSRWGATTDLPEVPDVEAPSADYARYDRYQRSNRWLSMNLTPDFPTVGTLIERLYATAPGQELDGTIVADPFALRALLSVAGPTDIPDLGVVDADSVVEYVTIDAYDDDFDSRLERKQVLGAVAAGALEGFLQEGGGDPLAALRALGDTVARGHLVFHAVDPEVQDALETAGIAGALPSGPTDAVVVASNSSTNAKVDAFLAAELTYDVVLRPDGAARGRLELRLDNTASANGSTSVIGPARPHLEAGENRFFLQVLGGPGGEITGFAVDGERAQARIESEQGLPAVVADMRLLAGETRTVEMSTTTPAAWTGDPDHLSYRLALHLPPLVRGVRTTVRVDIPAGMEVADAPRDSAIIDGAVVVEQADAGGRSEVELVFTRPVDRGVGAAVRRFLTEPVLRLGD